MQHVLELFEVYFAIVVLVAQVDQAAQLFRLEVDLEDGECGLEFLLREHSISVGVKDLEHFGNVEAFGCNCFPKYYF